MKSDHVMPSVSQVPAAVRDDNSNNSKVTGRSSIHLMHWFRSKGLRFHDQPSLYEVICDMRRQLDDVSMQQSNSENTDMTWRCVYLLDPWFVSSSASANKWRFLLQCLEDIDNSLRKMGSRLFVIRGQPNHVFPHLLKHWSITHVSFEFDPEPFAKVRDAKISQLCSEMGIVVNSSASHTLFNIHDILDRCQSILLTFASFQAIIASSGFPAPPAACPAVTPDLVAGIKSPITDDHDKKYGIPSLKELGLQSSESEVGCTFKWPGGETEGLVRLERHLQHKAWVAAFGHPKMTPNSLINGSQTGLTPYLRFGCLSARLFYHQLSDLYCRFKKSSPPHSLHGQLLWRDYFYTVASQNGPHFDRMQGNRICLQVPWRKDTISLMKWAEGKTGFPWIDSIQTQLRQEGWVHPVARHATICFLTRGGLWISWEEGMHVFDEMLLDADWSLNAGSCMWMSCSSFFQSHLHATYCPVNFGRKVDPNADYIRKYVPVLRNYPIQYIHEPWKAPLTVQQKAKCIIGKNYPLPMIDHVKAARVNMSRMRRVLASLANDGCSSEQSLDALAGDNVSSKSNPNTCSADLIPSQ